MEGIHEVYRWRPFLPPASWKAELNTSREHTKRYRSKMRSGILPRADTTAFALCAFGRGSIIASCSARVTVKKKAEFGKLALFRMGLKKYSSTAESKDYCKLNFNLNTKAGKTFSFALSTCCRRRRSLTKRFAKTYLVSMKSSLSFRKLLKKENATHISNNSGN